MEMVRWMGGLRAVEVDEGDHIEEMVGYMFFCFFF